MGLREPSQRGEMMAWMSTMVLVWRIETSHGTVSAQPWKLL